MGSAASIACTGLEEENTETDGLLKPEEPIQSYENPQECHGRDEEESSECPEPWMRFVSSQLEKAKEKVQIQKDIQYAEVEEIYLLYFKLRENDIPNKVNDFAKCLIKHEFIEFFCDLLDRIQAETNFWQRYFEHPWYVMFCQCRQLLWNLSDTIEEFAKHVSESEVFSKLLAQLESQELAPSTIMTMPKSKKKQIDTVDANLSILANCLRLYKDSKQKFRLLKGVEIVEKYLECESLLIIKMHSLCVLAFAADLEDNPEVLNATNANIKFIIENLLDSGISREDRIGHYEACTYSVCEILEWLSLLANSEKNSKELIQVGILEQFSTILEDKISDEEVYYTLITVYTLSFLSEGKSAINQHPAILSQVREFQKHNDTKIRKAAEGILWELSDKTHLKSRTDQIMISYCWDQKELARRLYESLKQDQLNIWMDDFQMEGNILDKMSEGVEGSSIVIVGLSEGYRNSPHCQTEANHAYLHRKIIIPVMMETEFIKKYKDGWLGALVANKMYYNIQNDFDSEIKKLKEYIAKIHRGRDETDEPQGQTAKFEDSFKNWSDAEVKNWWKQSVKIRNYPKGLNGKRLSELKVWQRNAPEFFLNFCHTQLKVTAPLDLLEFSSALRDLQ